MSQSSCVCRAVCLLGMQRKKRKERKKTNQVPLHVLLSLPPPSLLSLSVCLTSVLCRSPSHPPLSLPPFPPHSPGDAGGGPALVLCAHRGLDLFPINGKGQGHLLISPLPAVYRRHWQTREKGTSELTLPAPCGGPGCWAWLGGGGGCGGDRGPGRPSGQCLGPFTASAGPLQGV